MPVVTAQMNQVPPSAEARPTASSHPRATVLAHAVRARAADARVYEVAKVSPLEDAPLLSSTLGQSVLLKREDRQPVFSFKLRGAYQRMATLDPDQCRRGVVTASAGNHAQGVALAATRLGIHACIVMPETTPEVKVAAVRRLGGAQVDVVLAGQTYQEAQTRADAIAAYEGRVFVHPFNDLDVIAGQATVGLELLRQATQPIDTVFVPVGGGGLIAGIASVIKAHDPHIRVVGVQAADSDAMAQSLECGHRVRLPQVGLFADGTAVKQVGNHTFALCQHYVDAMLRVDNTQICAAMQAIYHETRCVAEPSGALALAGLMAHARSTEPSPGALVAVVSGANMNFQQLGWVASQVRGHDALD